LDSLCKAFEGRRKLFWYLAAAALVTDLVTKALLWHPRADAWNVTIVPGFLHLVSHDGNPQGAFGLGPRNPWFFIAAAIVGLAVIGLLVLTTHPGKGMVHGALGLLAGGAVGNLYDRLFRHSHTVRDFIDLHWREVYHWPVFNIADAAICVGFALVLYDSLLRRSDRQRPEEGP
jgi:signal peptidase II